MEFLSTILLSYLLLTPSIHGSSSEIIPLGSVLSSLDQYTWNSPSGDFAFGFYPTSGDAYVVGVWFKRDSQKTLVWTANRDFQVPKGSTVELTSDGKLVLKGSVGNLPMTVASSANGGVAYAAMLDTGNFVLQGLPGSGDRFRWQSFDRPTDTILPGQSLNPDSKLYSALTESKPSTGRYFLHMQTDGNLVLDWERDPSHPTDVSGIVYTSNTGGNPGKLVLNEVGNLFILHSDSSMSSLSSSAPGSDYYFRAVLGYDGVFRLLRYPKGSSGTPRQWNTVWSSTSDPCTVPAVCGVNGYCVLNANLKPDCICPPGFSYVNPSLRFAGCKPDFPVQDCRQTQGYTLRSIQNVDWPFGDYEQIRNMDEARCRDECMKDCMCTVAIFRVETCWKKKIPLLRGRMSSEINSVALIKVRK